MTLYKGELVSPLRYRILTLMDEVEDTAISDVYFIEEVFRAMGRDPSVYLCRETPDYYDVREDDAVNGY